MDIKKDQNRLKVYKVKLVDLNKYKYKVRNHYQEFKEELQNYKLKLEFDILI